MALFFVAAHITLGIEGKDVFTADPRDPGGPTKSGIASRYHPGVDVRHLSAEETLKIYRYSYWDLIRGDEFKSQALANTVFDHAIHDGPSDAVELLQFALGGFGPSLLSDGILGPKTMEAMARICSTPASESALVNRFNLERLERYYDKVRSHPDRACYLEGWWKRAAGFAVYLDKVGNVTV